MNKLTDSSPRESIWDILRGIAAAMMVLSHTLFFLSRDTPIFISILSRTLNTLTVSFFFITAGAVAAMKLSKSSTIADGLRMAIKRSSLIYGVYLLAASLTMVSTGSNGGTFVTRMIRILALQDVPSFTEFLLPLLVIPLVFTIFRPIIRQTLNNFWLTGIVSAGIYALGMWLYTIPVPVELTPYKALLVGSQGYLRFPVFQYTPLFLLGGWFALINKKNQLSYGVRVVLAGMISTGLCIALIKIIPTGLISPPFRWPPSVGFLSIGIVSYFCIFIFLRTLGTNHKHFKRIRNIFSNTGKKTLFIYLLHLVFLLSYKQFIGYTFYSSFSLFIVSCIVVISCCLLVQGRYATGSKQEEQESIPVLSFVFTVWSVFAVLIIINANPYNSPYGGIWRYPRTTVQTSTQKDILPKTKIEIADWYHQEYGYRKTISITNPPNGKQVNSGDTIGLQLDHAALVKTKKAAADGSDLQIVEQRNGETQTVPSRLIFPNTAFSVLKFSVTETIQPGKTDSSYTVYYGSDYPQKIETLSSDTATEASPSAEFKDEQTAPLLLTTNRRWFVKAPGSDLLALSIKDNNPEENSTYTYHIDSETNEHSFPKIGGPVQVEQIPIDTLPAGMHTITATKRNGTNSVISRKLKFMVSEPVYVAWTLDWEGWDVPDETLTELEQISTAFDHLPITHFFNPRIYIPSVMPVSRALVLTDWIKRRVAQNNDEVALHLHMHFDVLQAAGLSPRYSPKWGYRSAEGYDVLTTTYTQTELSQLLRWSKQQFKANNLPEPKGYRAGGWFADTKVLAALEENGFLYDSSGRIQTLWSGVAKSPWNLPITAQPYYPSRTDQNSAGTPAFSLLEIPNTAGDTNEYDATEILRRYRINVHEDIVTQKTAVVLLSHPQWASIEFPIIRTVLSSIQQRSYKKDLGPVIYVPVKTIYDQWK